VKRILFALLLCGLPLSLANAQDDKTEATLAASYLQVQNADTKTAALTGDLLFSIVPRLHLGPAVSFGYSKNGSVTSTGGAAGLGLEFDFLTGGLRPFAGVQALYWMGEFSQTIQYEASLRAGLKVGGGPAFLKLFYERTRQYEASGVFNAQQDFNQVVVGLGVRF